MTAIIIAQQKKLVNKYKELRKILSNSFTFFKKSDIIYIILPYKILIYRLMYIRNANYIYRNEKIRRSRTIFAFWIK